MERWLLLLFQRTWVGFSAPTLGSSWLSITLSLKDPVPSGTHCIALTLREIPLPVLLGARITGVHYHARLWSPISVPGNNNSAPCVF